MSPLCKHHARDARGNLSDHGHKDDLVLITVITHYLMLHARLSSSRQWKTRLLGVISWFQQILGNNMAEHNHDQTSMQVTYQ